MRPPATSPRPASRFTTRRLAATLTNSGTVTGGIAIDSSTINGQILDTGTLSGGIFIDSASLIATTGANAAVAVSGSIFSGGIANYGTITSASGSGIVVGGKVTGSQLSIRSFGGGINNAGTVVGSAVAGGGNGIWVGGTALAGGSVMVSTFTGGIINSGSISASPGGGNGIWVGGQAASGGSVTILTVCWRDQQFRHDLGRRRGHLGRRQSVWRVEPDSRQFLRRHQQFGPSHRPLQRRHSRRGNRSNR